MAKKQRPTKAPTPHVEVLPCIDDVERAVLALILVSGRTYLLENLEAVDFWNPLYRFLFTELRLMWESKTEPMGDVHAQVRWLQQPNARRRSREAMRESGDELKPEDVAATIAAIASEYAATSHESYYLRVLQQLRLRRGQLWLAKFIIDRDREFPLDPMGNMHAIQKKYDLLWVKAAELFPEEMGVTS